MVPAMSNVTNPTDRYTRKEWRERWSVVFVGGIAVLLPDSLGSSVCIIGSPPQAPDCQPDYDAWAAMRSQPHRNSLQQCTLSPPWRPIHGIAGVGKSRQGPLCGPLWCETLNRVAVRTADPTASVTEDCRGTDVSLPALRIQTYLSVARSSPALASMAT